MIAVHDGGGSVREHLERSASSIIMPDPVAAARLAAQPEMPTEDAAVTLWADFLAMHNRRGWTEAGPQRITLEAIHAWRTVRRIELEPWEFDAILALDDEFFAARAESKK